MVLQALNCHAGGCAITVRQGIIIAKALGCPRFYLTHGRSASSSTLGLMAFLMAPNLPGRNPEAGGPDAWCHSPMMGMVIQNALTYWADLNSCEPCILPVTAMIMDR